MDNIIVQMEQDFEALACEHEVAASNERLWAKGADDTDTAQMHEENADNHMLLAKMYRSMALSAFELAVEHGAVEQL